MNGKALLPTRVSSRIYRQNRQFLPLHTHEGPVLVGGIGSGLIAGMAAENWGGKLFAQMKTASFGQLQMEAAGLADDVLMSVMGGAYAASYHFFEYFTTQ